MYEEKVHNILKKSSKNKFKRSLLKIKLFLVQLQRAMGNEQIPNSFRRNYCVESLINSFTLHASTTHKQGKVHYRHSRHKPCTRY